MERKPDNYGNLLLIVFISPIGAPFLGLITVGACDIHWEEAYQCIVPDPIIAYFIISAFGPFFLVGQLGFAWLSFCFVALITVTWFFVRASWEKIFPL